MPTINFKGKSFVQNHHLAVKYHQLIPKKEFSLTDKVSLHDNLIIHGDNLASLKALLPTYAGKVKCIYISIPASLPNFSDHFMVSTPFRLLLEITRIGRLHYMRHNRATCAEMSPSFLQ